MDIQTLLIIILAILTVCIVAVSIYLIITLKELRGTLHRADNVLEDVETVTKTVSTPAAAITMLANFMYDAVSTVKSVTSIADHSSSRNKNHK